MPKKITRHSASAALELLPDGVLIVRLTGPLTGEALMTVKAGILADYAPDAIRAFVVDYTAAIIALTGEQLDQVLEGEAGRVPGLPAAMVVRRSDVGLFGWHAIRMAMHGNVRQVFTDHGQAVRWAARYAAAGA